MLLRRNGLLLGLILSLGLTAHAQRNYTPQSVLSSGTWYKFSVSESGIYKIDLAFLTTIGAPTSGLNPSSFRIFGNGGQMLNEANSSIPIDDLRENAIKVVDGGDGQFNANDYILFYANGPDQWIKDSANKAFTHQKNLFSDKSYYFLSIGGTGRRVANVNNTSTPNLTVTSFNGHFAHQLDSVNFLQSGKDWYGEEFASAPGKSLTRNFNFTSPNLVPGSTLLLNAECVARSAGAGSRFDISVNNNPVSQLIIPPVGTGPYDPFAQAAKATATTVVSQDQIDIQFSYVTGSFNAQGWLDKFEVLTRNRLSMNGLNQLGFRDWQSVGNNIAEMIISDAPATVEVWDVTDPLVPVEMQGSASGNGFRFINSSERLREYIAFGETGYLNPQPVGRIINQNLHAVPPADQVIICSPNLVAQAQRLANFHIQKNGLKVVVATTDQIYNEFSSGSPDPTAIRDFVKMYYDVNKATPANQPKYLLLFGDASYDYKERLKNNTSLVPAFESKSSLDILSTYTSDDYFGFLEDNEDINSTAIINTLDIGIGRIPAKNLEEARNFVDKLEAYFSAESFGPWRNNLTFIADDEDQNLHVDDAEIISNTAATVAPEFDRQKIYLDAFRQESGGGGSSYPEANNAINNQVFAGTLMWNFTGHGGPRRLAEETILDQETVNKWNNVNRLPLFLTATCDFAPYDNPLVNSLGENLLLRPKTGAIALMTTTRIVFSFSNRIMNNNYVEFALKPDANGRYRTLGEAVKDAKNFTYQNSADIINNRKFTLLGDPAMTIAFPKMQVRPSTINGVPIAQTDTLRATDKVVIEGQVLDVLGNLLTGFNGNVYPVVFDKPQSINTLANDPTSLVRSFTVQNNILFKGKASVTAGKFVFSFKVPRDINYQFGNGKLSLYAENGTDDGNGAFTNFVVGGAGTDNGNDKDGPEIKTYLNDEKFANGGLTNENPVLIVKLADSSGINTVGTGIGHDIVATLDNDNDRYYVLNDFYQGELDSYQKGAVRFQLPELSPGPHTLKVKAWDVLNNSNEVILDFTVAKDEELVLTHVLNYPNPFTTKTQFWFEHNKPGQDLMVHLQIFTLTGRVIKVFKKTINTVGNRSSELEWDGRDEFGDKIGRGVYLYKLTVTAPGKLKKHKIEKLVIF